MSAKAPKSPCISVCVLNTDDICLGCYRSASEITDWGMASDLEKRNILKRSQERIEDSATVRLN